MKMKNSKTRIMLIAIAVLFTPRAGAAGSEFQLRLESGMMFYSIEQAPLSQSTLSQSGTSSGANWAKEKVEFSDNLGFVGGGATLFFQQIFVDFSGQYAFNGEARFLTSESGYMEDENLFGSEEDNHDVQFYRTDMAISAGYAVNRKFSIYAGYKWAAVDLDTTFEGLTSLLNIDNWLLSGRSRGEVHDKWRYEGPFIGVAHGWEIDYPGFLKGLISAKVALAFLSSKYSMDLTGDATYTSFNGVEIEPLVGAVDLKKVITGDTLGLTFGFDWNGVTAIKSLSYVIGLSGYRYNFDADDLHEPDVSETTLIFRAVLAYVF
jgi:hypothetical protein